MRRKIKTQIDDSLRERMAAAADVQRRQRLVRVPLLCSPEPVDPLREPIPIEPLGDIEWQIISDSLSGSAP